MYRSGNSARGKKVVILGLPNSGKSQVFNNLTGEYSVVANFPLTTQELKRSLCRIKGQSWEVIDSPGYYSMATSVEGEHSSYDLILEERPDVIIQCIDAGRLKQSLALTAGLLELGIPLVVALNAVDQTAQKGIWIDSRALSRRLGVPVVETIAVQNQGTEKLIEALARARVGKNEIIYPESLEKAISAIEARLPDDIPYKHKVAVLLLRNDVSILSYLQQAAPELDMAALKVELSEKRNNIRLNIRRAISNRRSRWVQAITAEVVRQQQGKKGDLSARMAYLVSHPLSGIPILMLVVCLMYFLVVNVANVITDGLNQTLWLPVYGWLLSIFPSGIWHDLLIGDYGVFSLGIANALLTVLPILTVFFLLFNILEDIGYLSNLSVMTKRILEKFGLSGEAIMPLVLGFGCKTMATLTTRTLRSPKERCIAIYLIAFAIPCAAQTGINMSILGRIGVGAFILVFTVLALAEVFAGLALNRILKDQSRCEFFHELSPMRLPNLKGIMIKTWYRLYWFLLEAVPVFVYAAIALFVIDRLGILNLVRKLLGPLITGLLGLPVAMVDTLILCLIRREAAAGPIISLIKRGELDYVQCIVAVIITTMFLPCFANTMTMFKEIGPRRTLIMVTAINVSALVIAGTLHWTLTSLVRL